MYDAIADIQKEQNNLNYSRDNRESTIDSPALVPTKP